MRNRMKASASCSPVRRVTLLGALLVAAFLAACGHHEAQQQPPAQEPPATPPATSESTPPAAVGSTQESSNPCPNPPPCKNGEEGCTNYPFKPTDCWTTPYGPAKADVIVSTKRGGAVRSTNMLYCEGNTYALCFFSGPAEKTGTSDKNNPLPCKLNDKGDTADCTCQAYTSGANFVDINAILNRGAYFATVNTCGPDGSGCRNIVNCGPRGDLPGCKARQEAPVCTYVKDQSPSNPQGSLMPKADLISTFSFAMSGKNDGTYELGSVPCSGPYAGCMTAPCSYGPNHTSPTQAGELVQCQCPVYSGTFQVGQRGQTCSIAPNHVWSASNTVDEAGQ
jgi:hypothetical protein